MAEKAQTKMSAKGQERAKCLMTAAIDLFIERDYASVTIQDITKRAGVTHSLVYYHFKDKDALFNQAVTNLIETSVEGYHDFLDLHLHPVDLIEAWFENNINESHNLRKLVKIMFNYAGPRNGSPSVENSIREFYQKEYRILEDSVSEGIALGCFNDIDAVRIAAFVSTHIDGIFYDSFIRNDDDIAQAMVDLKWVLWTMLGYQETRYVEMKTKAKKAKTVRK